MIAILILAAGASSRMRGGDKLLEPVGGTACLSVLVKRALSSGFATYVVVPDLDHPRAQAASGASLIPAPDAHLGMAHSLSAGLKALPETVRAAIILPGDMPEIQTGDLMAVAEAHRKTGKGILQASTDQGEPGHPILFAAKYFAAMSALQGDRGAWSIIQAHQSDWLTLPLKDGRARLDLDTPEDWAAWRAGEKQD